MYGSSPQLPAHPSGMRSASRTELVGRTPKTRPPKEGGASHKSHRSWRNPGSNTTPVLGATHFVLGVVLRNLVFRVGARKPFARVGVSLISGQKKLELENHWGLLNGSPRRGFGNARL